MSRVRLDEMLLESLHWLNLKQENFGAEQLRVPTDAVKVSDRVVATCLTWNEFKVKQPSLCLCVRHWHTDEMKTCLHTSGKHPGGWGSPAPGPDAINMIALSLAVRFACLLSLCGAAVEALQKFKQTENELLGHCATRSHGTVCQQSIIYFSKKFSFICFQLLFCITQFRPQTEEM